ncbi:hypothetical protein [Myroides profundi]|uniref:Gliding motility-associated protein GldM C-terminal domain-containing protein n=1 Tax=Myroides profundi TaxID=480520 RepID=A0AAJ5BCE8_MYRPR|nr:hypothetical protein [Myroides profundi]AJH13490.1 hypothetical protein MPR_0273 [Myroides profundi]SEP97106.1 hypothetical protein SAMN04488089_101220 [Myroides profundi]
MKQIIALLVLVCTAISMNAQEQELREEIILQGYPFKIYTQIIKTDTTEETDYIIVGDISRTALSAEVRDLSTNTTITNGIYRKNDTELHHIEYDLINNKLHHKVYTPNDKGILMKVKEVRDLTEHPADLPPKFKDNKPIAPVFPGGDRALVEWTYHNIISILNEENIQLASDARLTLSVNLDGTAEPINMYLLEVPSTIEDKILQQVKNMPLFITKVQGYNVSGMVIIPIGAFMQD